MLDLQEQLALKDAKIREQEARIAQLEYELSELKRLIYGTKSERFRKEEGFAEQGNLFEYAPEDQPIIQATEQITYNRGKNNNHKGRNSLPAHLPVKEVVIEPEEDTSDMVKIGEQVTETLEYTPASLVKLVRIRPKYARKQESEKDPSEHNEKSIVIAPMPSRPIDKCIAEPNLLSHMIVSKFIDHLPFYRQIGMFKRDFGWEPPKSTVNDWFVAVCTLLEPLYNKLKEKVLESDYIQADESPIKVQDKNKKGRTHRGFQWVYHAPDKGIVLFHYHRSRSVQAPRELLASYKGWVQCDGYTVYDKLDSIYDDIRLAGCWVHARRGFDKAKDSDLTRAKHVLTLFSKIYQQESGCKELDETQTKIYRNQHIWPLVQELKEWIESQSIKVLPKSPLGKAMTYCIKQWPKLIKCFEDGRLELDNNLIENKIRPLALGRKNYLFAGSHDAAQRIAMIYSLFATCKIHEVNPRDWLTYVMENINDTKISDLDKLLPQYFMA